MEINSTSQVVVLFWRVSDFAMAEPYIERVSRTD